MKSTVDNIYTKGSEIAFVLESPHTDELFHGYPLAGSAGREISRYLFGRYDVPFGLVAYRRALVGVLDIPLFKPYSVINVTKQPLQKSAYTTNGVRAPENAEQREKLKKLIDQGADYKTKHHDRSLNELKAELYADFKNECEQNLAGYRVLVPCGRFARTFCEQLRQESGFDFELVKDIPHPSSGGWRNLDEAKLRDIKSFLLSKFDA